MINSRQISDLHPIVQKMALTFQQQCKEAGIEVLITSTYRDAASQNALYAIGRTVKGANPTKARPMGKRVTNAKGGQSVHNYRLALDFVPIINGKAIWNNLELFKRCGEIAEKIGFTWSGRWTKFPEMAHIQYTQGLSLADLQAGKMIK
jgi:peptidoglycan L-alanyl-D-glutamate endopeptidase CwlK